MRLLMTQVVDNSQPGMTSVSFPIPSETPSGQYVYTVLYNLMSFDD